MKNYTAVTLLLGITILLSASRCTPKKEIETIGDIYELRIYRLADPDQEKKLDAYLEKAFLPALKRNDVRNIGVFKFIPEVRDSIRQILVLYPVRGLARVGELREALIRDSVLQQDGSDFLAAPHDPPPYERLEVLLLKPFRDMPFLRPSALGGDREKRVYELRSYESATEELFRNKVEMFNEGGEVSLFEELGFNAVFYGEVLSGSRMPNLMYMTTFRDMEARDSLWQAFVESAQWKKLIGNPYYDNNVSKADIFLLTPTSYSDY